jgi:hypothetical protein
MAGAPVILCHAATNQYLCCEDKKYPNDFGTELEVSAHTTASLKVAFRLQGLIDGAFFCCAFKNKSNIN